MSTQPKAHDLLLELGTEELPPLALAALSQAFSSGIVDGLKATGLHVDGAKAFASPRRLAVLIQGLESSAPDQEIEKLGPNVKAAYDKEGKPSKAATGFAAGCGVSFEQLTTKETDKGERLAYVATAKGQSVSELLPDILNDVLAKLPIPKRMRWGASRNEFIRPVKWLVALFGKEILNLEVYGIKAGNITQGHRFHSEGSIIIEEPSTYESLLKNQGFVIADYEQRKDIVKQQLLACAKTLGGQVVIGDSLLEEVCSLVEWPQALAGKFDQEFLALPQEALISSMRSHQKYFHVLDNDGRLLPYFITVANIESRNKEAVIEGNERVIRPRLADAQFFYQTDAKTGLANQLSRLDNIVFQDKLGSVGDKTRRVEKLASFIANNSKVEGAPLSESADLALCSRAALLSKADLVTEMVGEFADLQGTMGRYYALKDGEDPIVAQAIEEHYLPRFAGDALPESSVGICIALADRLDTLVGIFGIGQRPTGSRDPFALRRAALAVLRICIEKNIALELNEVIDFACQLHPALTNKDVAQESCEYIMERLRSWYSEQGISAEIFMAVHAQQLSDPLDIDHRIKAVRNFSEHEAAPALAAADKRVGNLLSKQGDLKIGAVNRELMQTNEEKALLDMLDSKVAALAPIIAEGNYEPALQSLAELKETVDAFFDKVMVMDKDPEQRNNRLALLQKLRTTFMQIADISQLVTR